MTGVHAPQSQVKVRWNSATGPVLATTTATAVGNFTAAFTIPEASPDVYLVVSVSYDSQGNVLHASPATFTVIEPPELTVAPYGALPSSAVELKGSGFTSGLVELRWDSDQGPLLGTADGPTFTHSVDIPAGARGLHKIVARGLDQASRLYGRAAADVMVSLTAPEYPLPRKAQADTVGPAIAGAALSLANRNRTVSRKRYVTLFCGRYEEDGVRGQCGARSLRRLRTGRGRIPLTLGTRPFSAQKGQPVRVRFRLSRRQMAALKRARKVGMRGQVASRDRVGNESRADFRFSLKAPKRRPAKVAAASAGW